MAGPVSIQYDGLREVAQALRETDAALLGELKRDLADVGHVVEEDARRRFSRIDVRSAAGFETRVRLGGGATGIVTVGQKLRKTTGTRPQYGALQMRLALLPARAAKLEQARVILENGAARVLHEHGF